MEMKMNTPFDPNTFASMTFTESNSTEFMTVPVGRYPAVCDSRKVDSWKSGDGEQSGLKLILMWSVQDPAVLKEMGRDKVLVKQEMMLDMTETGGLAFGKGQNVILGQTREATSLNKPGESFSFDMFVGRTAQIEVGHRADKNKPDRIYAEVKAIAKL